jgi:hypothetical protein
MVPINESVVLLHHSHKLLIGSQLQEPAIAVDCPTQARSCFKFLLTLSERAIIKTELFSILDLFRSKHTDAVNLLRALLYFDNGLAIRIAAMAEP